MIIKHDEKLDIIRAMTESGGSFVRALANAWLYADDDNCGRIELAFPEYIARYRSIAAQTKEQV
jgi:hypothetical protein